MTKVAAFTDDKIYIGVMDGFEVEFFKPSESKLPDDVSIILLDFEFIDSPVEKLTQLCKQYQWLPVVVLLEPNVTLKQIEMVWNEGATVVLAKGDFEKINFRSALANSVLRKNYENQLANRTALFEVIIQSMPDAVIFTELSHKVKMVNPAFTDTFGYSADEIVGQSHVTIFASSRSFNRILRETEGLKLGEFKRYTRRFKKKNGTTFTGEFSVTSLVDSRKQPVGHLITIRDITIKENAESFTQYRLELEQLTTEISLRFSDFQNEVDSCINFALERIALFAKANRSTLFTITPTTIVNTHEWGSNPKGFQIEEPPLDYLVKKLRAGKFVHFSTGKARGGPRSSLVVPLFRGRTVCAALGIYSAVDQKITWPQEFADMLKTVGGVILNAIDQKTIEETLRRSEARLKQAQSVAHLGSWEINLKTKEVWWSQEVYEICGISSGNFVPTEESTLALFISPENRAKLREAGIYAIKYNQPYTTEARIRRQSDQSIRIIELHGSIEKNEAGEATSILGTVQDITERKQLEVSLHQKAAALEASNDEIRDFTYAASHDLKEPLRTVKVYLDLLVEELLGANQPKGNAGEYLEYIYDATAKMTDLIQNLLDYSRVTTRMSELHVVNVNDVLEKTLKSLKGRIEQTEAQIKKNKLPTLTTDPVRLGQVFQNLLSNALKFSRPNVKPVITVKSSKRNNVWRFTVSDNGIGIPKEYHEVIFRPFYRLNNGDTTGTGIGLAIVKKIIEHWGGEIWVESTEGQGSSFHFTIKESNDT